MRKLIIGAAIALLVSSGAMAQTSTVLRKPDGSGPIPADNSGLKVQGAGAAGTPAGGVVTVQGQSGTTPLRVDCVTGCSGGGGGGGAITAADGAIVNLGALADAAWSGTGNGTLTAILKSIRSQLAAALPLPTGASTAANQTAVQETVGAKVVNRSAIYDSAGNPVDWAAPVPVNLASTTTGGCTPYGYQSAATNNATSIATGARTLCGLTAINTTGALQYLRLYNLSGAPTCSSATGFLYTVPIPASTTGAGVAIPLGTFGQAFGTGLAFCLTGGPSSTDNTNATTGIFVIASFK